MSSTENLRAEVHKRWLEKTGKTANFTSLSVKDVCDMIWLIDEICFNDQIKKKLKSTSSTLECKINTKKSSIAGSCGRRGCHYIMTINTTSFADIFRKGEKVMVANGLYCNDTLGCFQLTVEHEMVHLMLYLWGHYGKTYKTARGKIMRVHQSHGELFQCMAKNLFGHTDFRHELGKEATDRLTKDDVHVKMRVQFTTSDGTTIIGTIIKKNPRKAKVETHVGVWNVSYSMLRKADDKKGAIPPGPTSPIIKKPITTSGLTRETVYPGMVIEFDDKEGVVHYGKIARRNKGRASVDDLKKENMRWQIPYYMMRKTTYISTVIPKRDLHKEKFKTGDLVKFTDSKEGKLRKVKIKRMNPKTATVQDLNGFEWRVPYRMLAKITSQKEKYNVGMMINYLDPKTKKFVYGNVKELREKSVIVENFSYIDKFETILYKNIKRLDE